MIAQEFLVLGPLEVRTGGRPVRLGGRKQRAVLAVLALHAGEVVSTERLIDLLWGESPPSSAATALHGHVSQLRKLVEPGRGSGAPPQVLVTRDSGYLLDVDPQQLDLHRFEALTGRAREALADGRLEQAAGMFRDALALWRGPPLGDLANEPFAQAELPRLQELRLAALEDRFEAELALGGARDLVAELEGHIARNPLRERPRGQLMLALYRAGRQAEALRAYQDARRMLVEEVGIEPGPELRRLQQAILDQDPSLDAEAPRRPRRREPQAARARRRGQIAAGALAVVAVVVLAGVVIGGGQERDGAGASVHGGSLAVIDLDGKGVQDTIAIGGTPTSVSVGEGAVWVLDADGQSVSRVDPQTRQARTFGTGGVPTDLAAGAGALWVGNGQSTGAQFVGPLATSVSNIDPHTRAIRARVGLRRSAGVTSNANANHIAVTRDAVWVVNPDFSVSRIDPRTNRIVATATDVRALAVAAGDEGVWALGDDNVLARVSGAPARVRIASNGLSSLAVGAGALWATAPYDGVLWRVDTKPRVVQRTINVGIGASAVTVGGGSVWVVNALRGTVSRVDPATDRVVATIDLGGTPRSAAAGAGKLWVTVAGGGAVAPAGEAANVRGALPAGTCGRVFYGGEGTPDHLIVSDLPLRGGPRLPTPQLGQAIAFVLRQRGFRAGRFKIGYQSCDDSTAQTGIFDPAKCAANAKAYAANPRVIGIIGPYNSGCAVEQIPIANRARGGPLAMLSPTNSEVGLTRTGPGTPEGGLRALYPTGRRNYARLFPTEAVQGAGDAVFAQRLGARGVYVLSDGGYGESMAFYFRRAARRLGLRVAGFRRWEPRPGGHRAVADAVARARVDAVFVSGLLDTGGGALVKALRRRLGRGVALIANDGFLPIASLFRAAGGAARGVYVSAGGVLPERLGPEGRNFMTAFAATQPGAVHRHSAYGAAAATLMLDAIARSDGSRADVTRNVLAAHPERSILGPLRFDARGDVEPAAVTVLRAVRGRGSDTVESVDGAVIERVVRVPRALTD